MTGVTRHPVTRQPVMRRLTRAAALALSLVAAGSAVACAGAARGAPASTRLGQVSSAPDAAPAQAGTLKAAQVAQVAQQLVRRGDMALEVEDVSATARRVERLATAMGGLVAQSSDDGRDDAHVSLRVPQDRLDATMDSVARLGHVERRATSSADVTEQVLDLDARIATLATTRDRLRQLLARAEAIRDVIEVERELQRVQSELESLDRRVTALRGQVAMSDLSVSIERRVVLGPLGQLVRAIGVGIGKLFVWR